MKLGQETAREYAYCSEGGTYGTYGPYTVVKNEIVETRRWVSVHDLVIADAHGKFWAASYERGLTESQDERPFEYDGEGVEFTEVERVPVTTYEYRKVTANG